MALDHGMNIDDVRVLGDLLKSASRSFDGIVHTLNAKVGSTTWVGPDAVRFKNDWWPGHRTRLQQLRTDLDGFGQSALNNATEQETASGVHGDGVTPGATHGAFPVDQGVVVLPGLAGAVTPVGRDPRDVQRGYDQWATGRFAAGGVSYYQCTGWANYRWHELGYDGPAISGNGRDMAANAPGDVSSQPSLHAMASSGATGSNPYGHVMVVEEVSADGGRIRVSEMNVGDRDYENGRPDEYRDNRWIARQPDGSWSGSKGEPLSFASLPVS